MIFESLKKDIILDFDEYINNNLDEDPKIIIQKMLDCIENKIDNDVLNKEDTEKGYALMMSSVIIEIPELLSYAIGDLFEDLIAHNEDCMSYVFSQTLISYTIREIVLHYYNKGLFTEDLLEAAGIPKAFVENPDNPYLDDGDEFEFTNQNQENIKKVLH